MLRYSTVGCGEYEHDNGDVGEHGHGHESDLAEGKCIHHRVEVANVGRERNSDSAIEIFLEEEN